MLPCLREAKERPFIYTLHAKLEFKIKRKEKRKRKMKKVTEDTRKLRAFWEKLMRLIMYALREILKEMKM